MKTLPALLAVAACQSAGAPAQPAEACALSIRFGSYAMGIDTAAARAVERLVSESKDVVGVTRSAAGREGEYVLCVETRGAAASARLAERVAALLPAEPRGPILVEGGGRRFEAPRR